MVVDVLTQFSPPAYLTDFDKEDWGTWDKIVEGWIDSEIAGKPDDSDVPRTVLTQFFNPKRTKHELSQTPVPITWVGFPLKLRMSKATDDARWSAAEDPEQQGDPTDPGNFDREMMDEYCEWSTKKDANGDVSIVSFTCEGPEYWTALAKRYPIKTAQNQTGSDTILKIYKDLNPDRALEIKAEDLVDDKGQYNTRNKWNATTDTGTIAHLIQRNNALSAEVDIGAQATVLRSDLAHGRLITNVIELCGNGSSYGNAKRNSDPTIGGEINTLARLGVGISIANPIALYFHATDFASFMLDPTGLRRGDIKDMIPVPARVFQYPRGDITKGYGLHIKVRIPDGMRATKVDRELNVSDLFDLNNGGTYVRYGSQFADYIFMSVSGIVSAEAPGVAPLQDSLTYTEPFVPPTFSVDAQAISSKAKSEQQAREPAAAKRKFEPQKAGITMMAVPQSLSARIKIKTRAG